MKKFWLTYPDAHNEACKIVLNKHGFYADTDGHFVVIGNIEIKQKSKDAKSGSG